MGNCGACRLQHHTRRCQHQSGAAAPSGAASTTGAASATPGADEEKDKATLIGVHKKAHELWNDRDLESFIPTFAPTIHYADVPTGHEVTNATAMVEFASKWFKAAPDAKLSGVYYYAGIIADQLGEYPASLDPSLKSDLWTVARLTLTGVQTG